MATVPERSKLLHNFSLPCLKWGSQRFLRCVSVPSDNNTSHQPSSSPSLDRRSSRSQSKSNQTEAPRVPKRKPSQNIDGVAGKNVKISNFEDGGGEEGSGGANGGGSNKPWNLRTRRAACKAPPPPPPSQSQSQAQGTKQAHDEERKFFDVGSSSSLQVKENKNKNMMMMVTNERAKFSVPLSKEEVEQDYWGLVGTRPPRRPKKRPRIVQRQLDTLFPGLWLTEVTAESYKVSDVPE